jgi:hypothetical protein
MCSTVGTLPSAAPRRAASANRRDEIGILGLELLELVQQAIELLVGDFGRSVDVITLFMWRMRERSSVIL